MVIPSPSSWRVDQGAACTVRAVSSRVSGLLDYEEESEIPLSTTLVHSIAVMQRVFCGVSFSPKVKGPFWTPCRRYLLGVAIITLMALGIGNSLVLQWKDPLEGHYGACKYGANVMYCGQQLEHISLLMVLSPRTS